MLVVGPRNDEKRLNIMLFKPLNIVLFNSSLRSSLPELLSNPLFSQGTR